ncbi:MAG: hypothetical protein WC602_02225 [archaeon]
MRSPFDYLLFWSVPTVSELVVADDGIHTTVSLRSSDFNTVEVLNNEIQSANFVRKH